MIINVNSSGIKIDVSASETLTTIFGTPHAVIPVGNIASFKIDPSHPLGEVVEVIDKNGDEYAILYTSIQSINDIVTSVSALDAFEKISLALLNL